MEETKSIFDKDIDKYIVGVDLGSGTDHIKDITKIECKQDQGKPRLDLVPLEIVEAIGIVMTKALETYTEGSARKVETFKFSEEQGVWYPIKIGTTKIAKEGNKMAVKMKVKDMDIGAEFNAGPAMLKVLEHFIDGTTLVITAESIGDRPFNMFPLLYERPEGFNLNDWRTSTIRKDLNENFLSALKGAGKINTDRIVTTEWDLSDHQGGVGYGTSLDKIGLLSQKQFKKYTEQYLLELEAWWWLITPYAGYSSYARGVDAGGALYYYNADNGDGGVRPAFRLLSETEILIGENEVNIDDTTPLETFTTRQLIEELFRRTSLSGNLQDIEGKEDNNGDNTELLEVE